MSPRTSVRLSDSAAVQACKRVGQVSVNDTVVVAEARFAVAWETGTPNFCKPNADKFTLPTSNNWMKEFDSVPCRSIRTPSTQYMRPPRENNLMTISVTNGPAKPPARCTRICINPFLTSQPSLAANFGSTKVVDTPVSSKNLGEGADKWLSAETGMDMESRGWNRAYVASWESSSAGGTV
ncbi:hypothetical protein C343_00390 [Cryptococcus neoformans C23]|nr:hypothetical protein C347_00468 [Cryptococcus neoformans var. grubii AD2-60a]OWZ47968.1 hypothetical protein C343_00390 [Cryptococcus neoformans var. grubii C23]OWZ58232.1 hypothetical protein C368_00389 [Cryptococcus neoformans var. grubii 125.91]OXC87228.1 hypothetical protein C344_00402 [Cryptococcus neoformans var. grubii AD1-7a]OXG99277.1 hypothetical protein C345_00125 [Cryptococcus neoformans var. grubii A2-102-5]OXH39993.1 hypothetical protein J005_00396 [Cryptococcus neoformans var